MKQDKFLFTVILKAQVNHLDLPAGIGPNDGQLFEPFRPRQACRNSATRSGFKRVDILRTFSYHYGNGRTYAALTASFGRLKGHYPMAYKKSTT
jgi:hypothetical protein